jgi:hypothetical protein
MENEHKYKVKGYILDKGETCKTSVIQLTLPAIIKHKGVKQ